MPPDDFLRANQRVSPPALTRKRTEAMVAPFFFAIGKSILGVLQQTHAELRHAKLHRLEAPLMKTLPQRINFAAMQHKFTENRYKSGIFCIPLPKLTTLSIGRSMRLEM